MDPQIVVNTLLELKEEVLAAVMMKVMTSKPELAPALVNMAIPDLTYAPSKSMTERRCTGTVSPSGGIDCPDLSSVFGCEVLVGPHQLGTFPAGTEVSFAVTLTDENRPQAFDLQPTSPLSMPMAGGMVGGMNPMAGGMNPMAAMLAAGKSPQALAAFSPPPPGSMEENPELVTAMVATMKGALKGGKGGENTPSVSKGGTIRMPGAPHTGKGPEDTSNQEVLGEFYGIVKSYNPIKGFGFIACDALKEAYSDGDVYLHNRYVGDFKVGQEVKFQAFLHHGRLQGRNLEDATGMVRPQSGVMPGVNPDEEQELGIFIGKVVNYDHNKGFGFIKCESLAMQGYQGDCFFDQREKGDFEQGDQVAFMAFLRKGKLAARELQPAASVLGYDAGVTNDGSIGGTIGGPPEKKQKMGAGMW
eukprot:TRINITY_DN1590_c0_g1_i2.p1 TRINITY_DN1590_c0_g1~~TRINITY_DN1590_c0_g1_i2.p1  ORF type:complete len:416 (+),score=97.08 TRINITY_DN1590_c0_g1_i2:169-1416(+)